MTESLYIDNTISLNKLLTGMTDSDWIAVDTEFVRERTYYPHVCLIQLACPGHLACIDAIAVQDLNPLYNFLTSAGQPKVIHAASQDLELIYQQGGIVPSPLFDTQIAAGLLGLGDQISYAELVEKLLKIRLPKKHTRNDWSKRPLSQDEIQYALDDVVYLSQLYPLLKQQLDATGRTGWMVEIMADISREDNYRIQPSEAWKRVKGKSRLGNQELQILKALAAWREKRAMTRNLPRKWVLKDHVLIDLCRTTPANTQQLIAIDDFPECLARRQGDEILKLISESASSPAEAESLQQKQPSPEQRRLIKKLTSQVKKQAEALEMSSSLLATRSDLTGLVINGRSQRLLTGWRYEAIGEILLRILEGEA